MRLLYYIYLIGYLTKICVLLLFREAFFFNTSKDVSGSKLSHFVLWEWRGLKHFLVLLKIIEKKITNIFLNFNITNKTIIW